MHIFQVLPIVLPPPPCFLVSNHDSFKAIFSGFVFSLAFFLLGKVTSHYELYSSICMAVLPIFYRFCPKPVEYQTASHHLKYVDGPNYKTLWCSWPHFEISRSNTGKEHGKVTVYQFTDAFLSFAVILPERLACIN